MIKTIEVTAPSGYIVAAEINSIRGIFCSSNCQFHKVIEVNKGKCSLFNKYLEYYFGAFGRCKDCFDNRIKREGEE